MKKRVLSGIICLLFILLLLTACRGDAVLSSSETVSAIAKQESVSEIEKTDKNGFTFVFDPYVLSARCRKSLGGTAAYHRFIDAVLAHESTFTLPSGQDYDRLRFAVGENFPLSFLIRDSFYNDQTGQVKLVFRYNEKQSAERILDFSEKIGDVLRSCVQKKDDPALASLVLYDWILNNISIETAASLSTKQSVSSVSGSTSAGSSTAQNHVSSSGASSAVSSGISDNNGSLEAADLYYALSKGVATSGSAAALYSFLLRQLGIDCETVGCWVGGAYRGLNLICLSGKWYYCDLTGAFLSGSGLSHFGLTQEALRKNLAQEFFLQNADGVSFGTGTYLWYTESLPRAVSKRFENLHTATSWEIGSDRKSLEVRTQDSRFLWEF